MAMAMIRLVSRLFPEASGTTITSSTIWTTTPTSGHLRRRVALTHGSGAFSTVTTG